jgi:hypothetical protein
MSLLPFTAIAAVSFLGSSVAWMPCEIDLHRQVLVWPSINDTTLEKPISWSPRPPRG